MHGLRKSAKTFMSEILIPANIFEKVLSHDSRSAVERTYDKNEYLVEKFKALCIWNYYLSTQLPSEYKELFAKMDDEAVAKCKAMYEKQASVDIFDFSF